VSKSLLNYVPEKSKNDGGSVDADFEEVAITVSLSLSAIKDANTLVIHQS
jgi:hypothetical protein